MIIIFSFLLERYKHRQNHNAHWLMHRDLGKELGEALCKTSSEYEGWINKPG